VFTQEHSFGRIFKVIPAAHVRQISMIWKMPASAPSWRSKSPQYMSHVFGHEGPNSLFSLLVKEGLATWISSGSSQKLDQSFDQFSIDIGPTEKGEMEYHRLIKIVFMFINQLKKEGIKDYIYEEFR